ncbi:MAG: tetratricopeptide repeat protein [Chloroflexales bacterium]
MLYQTALQELAQVGGSVWLVGLLHTNIGATHVRGGDGVLARQALTLSQQFFEQAGSRDYLAELHRHFAAAALVLGELDEAATYGVRALALARELAQRSEEGCSLRVLGATAAAQGQHALAETHLGASQTILDESGDVYEAARTVLALAEVYHAQGRMAEARATVERAIAVFAPLEAALDLAAAHALRARLITTTGDVS